MRVHDLISIVKGSGYEVSLDPKTCFIPWDLPEDEIPNEMILLRDEFGFMIQTEIV